MSTLNRSPVIFALQLVLLLSGWTVAAALGLRLLRESGRKSASAPITTPVPEGKIERIFREWSAHPQIAGAVVGFCVLDEDGRTLFASPLAGTALCPASALKTVTTGAALELLGPEFRFETILAATSPLAPDGSVNGDLVLIGGGDPTFSQEDLAMLAATAIAAGLKKVTGRLLADTSIFPLDPVSEHWNWGDVGNGYGAGAFGLNLDHNRLEVRFEPGARPGAPAEFLGSTPLLPETHFVNHVVTGPAGSGDGVVVFSEPYGRRITLRGTVPVGESGCTVSAAIPDPPALAVEFLRARLENAGVEFAGGAIPANALGRIVLATHRSVPLSEIINHLHQVSDNLEAQSLFLMIGRRQNTAPADAVRRHWEKAGIQFVGLRLLDGSGLARANMIRPLDLARVNLAARCGPHGNRFSESLSKYAHGHVRGKIGGMSGVKTQVGFIRSLQGRELTFALLANGLPPGREFWQHLEDLLEAVRTAE